MLSLRVLPIFALVALASAWPPYDIYNIDTDFQEPFYFPWSSWFRDLFRPIFVPFFHPFPSFSERFGMTVNSDDKEMNITTDVKDFKKDELTVKVEDGFVILKGTHKSDKDGTSPTKFFQMLTIPKNASENEINAKLYTNGILKINVPIGAGPAKEDKVDITIPIEETGAPYETTKINQIEKSAPTEGVEPTTLPSDNENDKKNEQDNMIPHGDQKS